MNESLWINMIPGQYDLNLPKRIAEGAVFGGSGNPQGPIYTIQLSGYGENSEAFLGALKTCVSSPFATLTERTSTNVHHHFTDSLQYIGVNYYDAGGVSVNAVFREAAHYQRVWELCQRHIRKAPQEPGAVYTVIKAPTGLTLHKVGKIQSEFSPDNYSEQVVADYSHISQCMRSKDPCGRLIMLAGPPGTGKSYLVRSLINDINATFVLVGASLVGEISGPEILPVLLQASDSDGSPVSESETKETRPVVLILEDADGALIKRELGNVDRISDVLNLGDGLLGELVDVRIIATTNADKIDLDPAIIRPGRMCRHTEFEALTSITARNLFKKLTGNTPPVINAPRTLAEVYRMARQDGWVPPGKKEHFGDYR